MIFIILNSLFTLFYNSNFALDSYILCQLKLWGEGIDMIFHVLDL